MSRRGDNAPTSPGLTPAALITYNEPGTTDHLTAAHRCDSMPTITLYSKPNCPLCDQARHYLAGLLAASERARWTLDEVNILDDPALYREYRYRVQVVAIEGGVTLVAPLSLQVALLRRALEGADTAP